MEKIYTYLNGFIWSVPRDYLFKKCLRGYYYRYSKINGGSQVKYSDEQKRILFNKVDFLNRLETRSSWVEKVVHNLLHFLIDTNLYCQPISFAQVADLAYLKMRSDWESSKDKLIIEDANTNIGLVEHYYNQDLSDECFERSYSIVRKCFQWLFESDLFPLVFHKNGKTVIECETPSQFSFNRYAINVKVDLLLRNEDGFVDLVDWKTLNAHYEEESPIKLLVHSLYASEKYSLPIQTVRSIKVDLNLGKADYHQIDDRSVVEIKDYINDSACQMIKLLPDTRRNNGELESFPMTTDMQKCSCCTLRGICLPEQYQVDFA
jgi:hypothetical protein